MQIKFFCESIGSIDITTLYLHFKDTSNGCIKVSREGEARRTAWRRETRAIAIGKTGSLIVKREVSGEMPPAHMKFSYFGVHSLTPFISILSLAIVLNWITTYLVVNAASWNKHCSWLRIVYNYNKYDK